MNLKEAINKEVEDNSSSVITLRRLIHENPEIGLDTYETGALICKYLEETGIPFQKEVGKSGVVALIEGKCPDQQPCILIRADMDALPMPEPSGLEYASKNEGKMHACGHDLHAAALAGVARVLWSLRNEIGGSIKLAFQPGEETADGASAMIEDGLLRNPTPQYAIGFHNWPPLETGIVAYHPTVSFSGAQSFSITINGRSGHGAHPHLAVDAITAVSSFIMQLQTIVSREIAPIKPAVISVGKINGGNSKNSIADRVTIDGTMRSFDLEGLSLMRDAIIRLLEGLERGMNITFKVSFDNKLPPVINDRKLLKRVLKSTRTLLGEDQVLEMAEGSLGAEDFSLISSKIPSAHLRIGSRIPGSEVKMIHSSDYLPDEGFLDVTMRLLSQIALDLSNQRR